MQEKSTLPVTDLTAPAPKDWTSFIALLVFNAGRQAFVEWTVKGQKKRPANPAAKDTSEGKLWEMGWKYEEMKGLLEGYVTHALADACHQIEDEYCSHAAEHGPDCDSCYAQEQYQTLRLIEELKP